MIEHESANIWTEDEGPLPETEIRAALPITKKDQSFCRIPRWIMKKGLWADLSGAEARLLGAITFFANQKRGYRAWPRMNTLAKMAGLHEETLRLAKKALQRKGLIKFGYAPDLGPGRFLWLATTGPFNFSDDCKQHLKEPEHAS